MKKLFFFSIVLLLTACGSKLDGTYTQDILANPALGTRNKEIHITFKSNGKASTNIMLDLGEMELPYEIDGDQITIHFQNGAPIWKLNKDGSIDGGMFGIFTKK